MKIFIHQSPQVAEDNGCIFFTWGYVVKIKQITQFENVSSISFRLSLLFEATLSTVRTTLSSSANGVNVVVQSLSS